MISYYVMPGLKRKKPLRKVIQISPERILRLTGEYFSLTPDEVKTKQPGSMAARRIAMYLCRKYTLLNHSQVSSLFGCKQHVASMYATRAVEGYIINDECYRNIVTEIESLL